MYYGCKKEIDFLIDNNRSIQILTYLKSTNFNFSSMGARLQKVFNTEAILTNTGSKMINVWNLVLRSPVEVH
jgi:hypothetical protein